MERPQTAEVTQLLAAWTRGERVALEKLVPAVRAELNRLAGLYVRRERPGHTLQTAALVNEAYLRLVDCSRIEWRGRTHFIALCAKEMRRVLVDYARAQGAGKRGVDSPPVSVSAAGDVPRLKPRELVALDGALDALAATDPRKARVIELRFFGGLNARETAEALQVSEETVLEDWKPARAWLLRATASRRTSKSPTPPRRPPRRRPA